MRLASRAYGIKPALALLFSLACLAGIRCMQPEEVRVDELSVHVDSLLLSVRTVRVSLLDTAGGNLQTLFADSLPSLSGLAHLRLTTDFRGRAFIRIEGEKRGRIVYDEIRGYDLAAARLLDVRIRFNAKGVASRPPAITGLPEQMDLFTGDTLRLSGTARDSDGVIVFYAWTFAGGVLPDTTVAVRDSLIALSGLHAYARAGSFRAILEVCDSTAIVKDTVTVTVRSGGRADARFKSLSLAPGKLAPELSEGVSEYTDSVDNNVATALLSGALASDSVFIVKVGGRTVLQNALNESLALDTGWNAFAVVVRTWRGVERTYTFRIYRRHGFTRSFGGGSLQLTAGFQRTDGIYLMGDRDHGIYLRDMFLIRTNASGDSNFTWTYGTTNDDLGRDLAPAGDGLIFLGSSDKGKDIVLVRADAAASPLWTRAYSLGGTVAPAVVVSARDGGFAVAGSANVPGVAGDLYFGAMLMKVAANSEMEWRKIWDLAAGGLGAEGRGLKETSDGGFILAGRTLIARTQNAGFLLRADPSGDTLWTRTFAGGGTGSGSDNSFWDVALAPSGGFFAMGSKGIYSSDIYAVRTDAQGSPVWEKTFGGTGVDQGRSILATPDGGFVVGGFSTSYGSGLNEIFLLKVGASGAEEWHRTYGSPQSDQSFKMTGTPDGGYLILGGSPAGMIKVDAEGNLN